MSQETSTWTKQIYVFTTMEAEGEGLDSEKLAEASLPYPPFQLFITDRSNAVRGNFCFM